jgi:diguanylate cyclase (GGDEF)-like protein
MCPSQTNERDLSSNPGSHLVQFYSAELNNLIRNVVDFVDDGLRLGESVLIIAVPERSNAFMTALAATHGSRDRRFRRLVILDAQTTLDQFMPDGQPDWQRFERIVGNAIRGARRGKRSSGVRVYAEITGILWSAGQIEAAARLEKFWNTLLAGDDFTLFCGYSVDIFADEFSGSHLNDVIRRHTHVIPDAHFQTELLKLTNDLSVMVRKAATTNRYLKDAYKTIERRTRTDALTGLASRRTLDEAFQREIARAQRLGEGLSIIIADLDYFKSINDQFGHVVGDQVLAGAAEVFGSRLRPYDLAARYGGDEFVLLLPGISTGNAIAIAERIRKEVAEIKIPGCSIQITVSIGVGSWMTGEVPEGLVARADAALYNAKRAGRNRVEVAAGRPT